MRKKVGLWALGLILNVPIVVLIFKLLPMTIAPKVAGTLFITIGLGLVSRGFADTRWRKTWVFWWAWVHLVFSLTLITIHVFELGRGPGPWQLGPWMIETPFAEIWHKLAERVYSILILTAIVDWLRLTLKERTLKGSPKDK